MIGAVLTVGMSIVARSITEVSVTTTQEESSRALEAAEAGIERAIGGAMVGSSLTDTIPTTNSTFNVVNSFLGNGNRYAVPVPLADGDVATIDLTGYSANQVRICWGQTGQQPSIEVVVYYITSSGVVGVSRNGYSPSTQVLHGFNSSSAGCGGTTGYNYSQNINFVGNGASQMNIPNNSDLRMMRVRMINAVVPQRIMLSAQGATDFPAQGNEVISTGQSGLAAQKVKAVITKPDLPPMFDFALFSGTSLVQ